MHLYEGICPKCGQHLKVAQTMIGSECECPACKKIIVVGPPKEDPSAKVVYSPPKDLAPEKDENEEGNLDIPEFEDKEEAKEALPVILGPADRTKEQKKEQAEKKKHQKQKYWFARHSSLIAYPLAVIVAVCGLVLCFLKVQKTIQECSSAEAAAKIQVNRHGLLDRQKAVRNSYFQTLNLLKKKKESSVQTFGFQGFDLDTSLSKPSLTFNEKLETEFDFLESAAAAEQLSQNMEIVQKTFREKINRLLYVFSNRIERLTNQISRLESGRAGKMETKKLVFEISNQIDFYPPETDFSDELKCISECADRVNTDDRLNDISGLRAEISDLIRFSNFVSQRLINDGIQYSSGDKTGYIPRQNLSSMEIQQIRNWKQELEIVKEYFNRLAPAANKFSKGWNLPVMIKNLRSDLLRGNEIFHEVSVRNSRRYFSLGQDILIIIATCVCVSFLILLFHDCISIYVFKSLGNQTGAAEESNDGENRTDHKEGEAQKVDVTSSDGQEQKNTKSASSDDGNKQVETSAVHAQTETHEKK